MTNGHSASYDLQVTRRCERALVTLIGDIGPWSRRLVLVGGLGPRYIIGKVPFGAAAHVGTADVDLVIKLAIEEAPETYSTLSRNLISSGFAAGDHSYQWSRQVDGTTVIVEFLCETDEVEAGRIYRPGRGTGSGFGACNVPGAQLATQDFISVELEAERLDDGGLSKVKLRVAGLLTYVVLKVLAFQDRHHDKDAYDLVYTLLNYPGGGRLLRRPLRRTALSGLRGRWLMLWNCLGSDLLAPNMTGRRPMPTSSPDLVMSSATHSFETLPLKRSGGFSWTVWDIR